MNILEQEKSCAFADKGFLHANTNHMKEAPGSSPRVWEITKRQTALCQRFHKANSELQFGETVLKYQGLNYIWYNLDCLSWT